MKPDKGATSSAATRCSRAAPPGAPATRLVCLVLDEPRAIGARLGAGAAAGRRRAGPRHDRRLRLRGGGLDRLGVGAGRRARSRARGSRSTSSGTGSAPRCAPSRCTTRRASASGPEVRPRRPPLCSRRVKGRSVIVTGGASGMGAACARLLADAGAQVVIVDRNGAAAAGVAADIGGDRGGRRRHRVRVLRPGGGRGPGAPRPARRARQRRRHDRPRRRARHRATTTWHRQFRVNVDGTFFMSRAAVRAMQPRGTRRDRQLRLDLGRHRRPGARRVLRREGRRPQPHPRDGARPRRATGSASTRSRRARSTRRCCAPPDGPTPATDEDLAAMAERTIPMGRARAAGRDRARGRVPRLRRRQLHDRRDRHRRRRLHGALMELPPPRPQRRARLGARARHRQHPQPDARGRVDPADPRRARRRHQPDRHVELLPRGRGRARDRQGARALRGRRDDAFDRHQVPLPDRPRPERSRQLARCTCCAPARSRCGACGVDHIDLYQSHRPDLDVPLDETLGALDDLVRQGKVRYVGTSTSPAWHVMEARDDVRAEGRSCASSPSSRRTTCSTGGSRTSCCRCAGGTASACCCWSPLAMGMLAGRYATATRPGGRLARGAARRHLRRARHHGRASRPATAFAALAREHGWRARAARRARGRRTSPA